jgi:hypothetical protein
MTQHFGRASAFAKKKQYLRRVLLGVLFPKWQPSQDFLVGMTTPQEQKYYQNCVLNVASMNGAIVDLGCWLCSTTIPLAKGLASITDNTLKDDNRIYAFDRFVWEKWMDPFMGNLYGIYRPGDSFLPEARKRVETMASLIEFIPADLTSYNWDGGPVRLLLVDAMKSEVLARAITLSFFTSLIEGSLLIHQDFKHFHTSWIHLLQYRLRDCFSFDSDVSGSGTVSFRTIKKVSIARAREASSGIFDANPSEVQEAFKYSLGLVKEESGRSAIAAAHVMHYVHCGQVQLARQTVTAYNNISHPFEGDFQLARERVQAVEA